MGSKGSFVVSLDCEGLWGMADNDSVLSGGTITQDSLGKAYEQISRVLDEAGVRVTAAFVSAFAAPGDALRDAMPELEELAALEPGWFAGLMPRLRRFDRESLDGLEGNAFWRRLAAEGHELAWHGATHMSLADTTSVEAMGLELRLEQKLSSALGRRPTSVVFPRNQVGHLEVIGQAGFRAYRAGIPRRLAGRALGLLGEWNVFEGSSREQPVFSDGLCMLPPGNFLNWPRGARAVVPPGVTVRRWKSMLRDAVARAGHVHMWFHPHNLVTAPAMLGAFEQIVQEAGRLVRGGALENLTMGELREAFVGAES